MKNNWAITTTLACCSMFAGTIMAQQGQRVSSTLDQWANKSKTETSSTPTYTANRRIEDVTGLEKARSRGTNTEASTTQANDRRDPRYNDNDSGYKDYRRQPEYNDRNARNRNYDPRDDDRRRYDDRDRHESCSKDKYRGRDNHGYGRGSANRSNNRDRDDDRYRDRDDDRYHDRDRDGKSRRTCDSNGKNRGRGY